MKREILIKFGFFLMETQGIKYTGSKRGILPVLLELIKPLNVKTTLDGFSGTTRVSQALKQAGYTVYANDIADWSKVFGEMLKRIEHGEADGILACPPFHKTIDLLML